MESHKSVNQLEQLKQQRAKYRLAIQQGTLTKDLLLKIQDALPFLDQQIATMECQTTDSTSSDTK
jgi:hypothetical protein